MFKMKLKRVAALSMALASSVSVLAGTATPLNVNAVATDLGTAKTFGSYKEPAYVDANYDGKKETVWSTFTMGSYPQSEITSANDEFEALTAIADSEWSSVSNPYLTFKNSKYKSSVGITTYNGNKYLRMKKADATKSSGQDYYYKWENSTSYHYFKFEPIKWRVLSINDDASKALVLADQILDNQPFNYSSSTSSYKSNHKPNDWGYSTLRSFMSGLDKSQNVMKVDYAASGISMVDMAFTDEEKSYIIPTNNKSSKPKYVDSLFCLSYSDVQNDNYGFGADPTVKFENRIAAATDYSKAMGLFNCGVGGYWWSRSGGTQDKLARNVDYQGDVHRGGNKVSTNDMGIRPAMYVNLASIYNNDAATYTGYVDNHRDTHRYRICFKDMDTGNTFVVSDTSNLVYLPYNYEDEAFNYSYKYKTSKGYATVTRFPIRVSGNFTIEVTRTLKATPTVAPTTAPTATPVVTVAPTSEPTTTPVVTVAPTNEPTATPVVTVAPTNEPTATPVVTEAPKNQVVVYYKRAANTSWKKAYVHYKVNGTWTKSPGVAMEKVSDGYWKITIDLGSSSDVAMCFNNGSGSWDNNSSKNYVISGAGSYTVDQTTKTVSKN